jgi:hypothetical protein
MPKNSQKSKAKPKSLSPAGPATKPGSGPAPKSGGRRLGLRGSAPWAARHAQKHAEEAAARNREPPRPGSARATLRTPGDADAIKARISELHQALLRIRSLRKNLGESFFQLGQTLERIRDQKLYDAKGYSSFEAFLEREVDLGKATALRLARVPAIFVEAAAQSLGLTAILAAIDAIDAVVAPADHKSSARNALPLKPPR